MEICQDHWHELKNSIRQRGMWRFVPPDVTTVRTNRAMQNLETEPASSTFDPLTMASMMISQQALMAFGAYLETRNYTSPGGQCQGCPLCEVEQNLGKGSSMEWIDVNADTLLQLCRERHLIGSEDF